jgi:PST family polysaccharide transporter
MSASGWLILERCVVLLSALLVGILLARHLGPDAFGSLSYAIAFVALLSVIPYLGLASVVVQELVHEPSGGAETMGTVFWAKLAAAVGAMVLGNLLASAVVDGATERMLILLISISMIFDASSATRLLFEARTQLRGVALVSSAANVVGAVLRVIALWADAPLWVFGALVTVQSAVLASGYGWLYRRQGGEGLRLPFRWSRAKQLLARSWPLIIASSAAMVYLKIDQFMIGQMRDMHDVGTYAVAARFSEVWYFIPTAVATAIFPRLLELRSTDQEKYLRRLQETIRYLFWSGLLVAIVVSLGAPALILVLFGTSYADAGTILAIHVWACPAVFMGMAVEKWLVAEDLLKFLVWRQLLAACVNVGLNLALIPKFGGTGAAVATVTSYVLAYYLSCFTDRRTIPAARWMTEAMLWPILRLSGRANT